MTIGHFEYDGHTWFFGRASDGTITPAKQLDFEVIADLAAIETRIANRPVTIPKLIPIQTHVERKLRKIEFDYTYDDWLDNFVIVSWSDPAQGLRYLSFRRPQLIEDIHAMIYVYQAVSLPLAIERGRPSYGGPGLQ